MKFFFKAKDGGPESKVTGYWLMESKKFFSIVLLRFDKGSREAYHTHAFHALSWVLYGELSEIVKGGIKNVWSSAGNAYWYRPSLIPIFTSRARFHRVWGEAEVTWALSIRGPWLDKWKEYLPQENKNITLTHGRKEI